MIHVTSHQTAKRALHLYFSIQSLSTSGLALVGSFPAVPTAVLPPAVMPLPVAPPVVTIPGFVAMADPDDAFCNVVYSSLGVLLSLCNQLYNDFCRQLR